MTDRQVLAITRPDTSLPWHQFPGTPLPRSTRIFRAALRGRGPWYFSPNGSGRFDLRSPRGTCYAGTDEVSAFFECIGLEWSLKKKHLLVLYEQFLLEREIHEHRIPDPIHVATLEADGVFRFHITNELTVMTPYDIPREYAEVLDEAVNNGQRCFNGIMYRSRFDPRLQPRALALFDEEGEKGWVSCTPHGLDRNLIAKLKTMGIDLELADIPPTDEMR